jgi:hypothetical protein
MVKNITNVSGMQKCHYCDLKGFFVYTPSGADYITCPCCGDNDFVNTTNDDKYDFNEFKNGEPIAAAAEDLRSNMNYCEKCGIMFGVGCVHAENGCTSNVYNSHLIQSWKNKLTEEVYEQGMPQFENVDDWFDNANNVEIIKMFCPHKADNCKKAYYKKEDHPKYYIKCCLDKS